MVVKKADQTAHIKKEEEAITKKILIYLRLIPSVDNHPQMSGCLKKHEWMSLMASCLESRAKNGHKVFIQ